MRAPSSSAAATGQNCWSRSPSRDDAARGWQADAPGTPIRRWRHGATGRSSSTRTRCGDGCSTTPMPIPTRGDACFGDTTGRPRRRSRPRSATPRASCPSSRPRTCRRLRTTPYSPEFYTNQLDPESGRAIAGTATRRRRRCSPPSARSIPQLFSTIDEWVSDLLDGDSSGKHSPGRRGAVDRGPRRLAAARNLVEAERADGRRRTGDPPGSRRHPHAGGPRPVLRARSCAAPRCSSSTRRPAAARRSRRR